MDKKCIICNNQFFAKRTDAKFCSASCRVKYSRQVTDDPVMLVLDTKDQPTGDLNGVDAEGFPLDHTKFTQEQVEAYYTLERFPSNNRYYSLNGGGSGSVSPYLSTHPAYKAYLNR